MSTLRVGSFCSGIAAPETAWHPLGWAPQFFSEIDPFASAVLAHRFPGVPNVGDMNDVDTTALPPCDVWVAGTPCQAFSVAGLRQSLSDDRGNLTLHFVRLVHAADPRIVVWENVPGVLSTSDNAFGCFLAGLVGEGEPLVCGNGSWPDAGMAVGPRRSAAWRVLDAQYLGLAQRRRRVFVVSFRTGDGANPGAVLFEPESLPRHSPPSREAGARVAASLTRGADSGGAGGYAGRRREDDFNLVSGMTHGEVPPVCPAIKARDCKGPSSDGDGDGAILVPMVTHSLRADGFDASEDGTGRGTPLVPVAYMDTRGRQNGDKAQEDQAFTLHAAKGQSEQQVVAYGVRTAQTSANGHGVTDDVAHTLDRANGQAVAFQTRIARNGRGQPEDICPTLQGAGAGATSDMRPCVVAFAQNQRDELREMEVAGALASEPGMKQQTYLNTGMAVRRLTPRECERLQGFPDDYTLIPYRGKPAADGPRYRALGNSMAVPVLKWIGERIQAVEAARKAGAA